jgi:Na+-transporting NADH:ubiquinone oxidoreductase subunit C
MRRDVVKPFLVTFIVSVTCSLLVSVAAVGLRGRQEENRRRDIIKQVLIAADMYDPSRPVEEAFAQIDVRVVDLDTGEFIPREEMDPQTYDQRAAAQDLTLSDALSREDDIARIGRREEYALVGQIRDEDGKLQKLLLPIRGQGLWSTMHGIISLDADLDTITGLVFYEHAETAGLGAEVANPSWQAGFVGRRIFDDEGRVALEVAKGAADPSDVHAVDGLSGATLTANGVTALVRFWFSESGYGPMLARLREEGGVDD